jgi:hypothetical protein
MVPHQRLIEATASRWTWLAQCWRLRQSVRALADHATTNGQAEALKAELVQERDTRHLLKLELDALKDAQAKEAEGHKLARNGNQALLRFIHTGHRLNVKFDPESIRAALQRSNEK